MDTTRKYCIDELPKGCIDCQKEDIFGDICHAYRAYYQGMSDAADKLRDMFDYDLFTLYSNDDRFISFNNLSLMIRDMVEQLKGQKNE